MASEKQRPGLDSAPHEYALEVLESHLDELGHVNNAKYFEFFEAGRTTWYDVGGLLRACRAAGHQNADTVVVNVNCDFLAECRLGERLTVLTWPQRMGTKSFAVLQRLMKADGAISAEAVVTSVGMDLDTRVAIALPSGVSGLFPPRE